MDNANQPPSVNQAAIINTPTPLPTATAPLQKTSFFANLFGGRMNRISYILGFVSFCLGVAVISLALFTVFYFTLGEVFGSEFLFIFLFIIFLFYTSSFSIRRLHDLNKSGLFLLLFLPGEIATFFFLVASFSGPLHAPLLAIVHAIPSFVDLVLTVIRYGSILFILYMLLWPGTSAMNNHGTPSEGVNLKEIFGLAAPKISEEVAASPEESSPVSSY